MDQKRERAKKKSSKNRYGDRTGIRKTTHLGRIFQVDHGRVVDALAGRGFGGVNQVAQGRCDVLYGVDQHDLKVERKGIK